MSLKRIIIHWTGGAHTASDLDKKHYHFIVQGDGSVVQGNHTPEDNIVTTDDIYGAHTRMLNTGSIGVSVAAMAGAVERPFNAGKHPITPAQVQALAALVARLCRQYKIPVSRTTVLTHAEVQPTLGVAQRGKWDIRWLPGDKAVGDAVQVGDRIRALVTAAMGALK
jgi:N-acetyl-anhydromuramyl-L-alanine amidase AmpD